MTRQQINARLEKLGYVPTGTLWKRPADRQEQHDQRLTNGLLTWANAAIECGFDPAAVIQEERAK